MLGAVTVDLLSGVVWAAGAALVAGALWLLQVGLSKRIRDEVKPMLDALETRLRDEIRKNGNGSH